MPLEGEWEIGVREQLFLILVIVHSAPIFSASLSRRHPGFLCDEYCMAAALARTGSYRT